MVSVQNIYQSGFCDKMAEVILLVLLGFIVTFAPNWDFYVCIFEEHTETQKNEGIGDVAYSGFSKSGRT